VAARTDADDVIHVVFRFRYVHYLSGDGSSWSSLSDLATSPGSAELPALVIDEQGGLHVAWQMWVDEGGWRPDTVRYATGQGSEWSAGGEGIVVYEPAEAFNPPELAVAPEGTVLVSWVEGTAVHLSLSHDGGQTFGEHHVLATDAAAAQDGFLADDLATPPIALDSEQAHLVYEDQSRQLIHVTGLYEVVGDDDDSAGGPTDDDDTGISDDDDTVGPGDDDDGPDDDGPDDDGEEGGCSCRQNGGGGSHSPATLLVLILLAFRRRPVSNWLAPRPAP